MEPDLQVMQRPLMEQQASESEIDMSTQCSAASEFGDVFPANSLTAGAFKMTAKRRRGFTADGALTRGLFQSGLPQPQGVQSGGIQQQYDSFMKYGAVVMTWILGLCGTLYLLTTFEEVLKPMVTAIIFVAFLEYVVQCMESFFIFSAILAVFLVKRLFWIVVMIFKIIFAAMSCSPANYKKEWKEIRNLQDLSYGWHPSLAGKYTVPRVLGIVILMIIIAVIAGILQNWVIGLVNAIVADIALYRYQLQRLIAVFCIALEQLPDQVPTSQKTQVQEAVQQILDSLTGSGQAAILSWLQEHAVASLNGIVASTSSFIYQFMFFLLYTFLFLFSPLHINPEEQLPSGTGTRRDDAFSSWKWSEVTNFVSRIARTRMFTSMPPEESLNAGDWRSGHRRDSSFEDISFAKSPTQRRDSVQNGFVHALTCLANCDDESTDRADLDAATSELQSHVYNILWQYFALLAFVNLIFAVCVELVLGFVLRVKLALVVAIACFFLAFIPELGAIVAVILPIPVILLSPDGIDLQGGGYKPPPVVFPQANATNSTSSSLSVEDVWPGCTETFTTAIYAVISMFLIKLIVSNWLSSMIMGRNAVLSGAIMKDQMEDIQETHPATILFAVVVAGQIWGGIGMIISVPVLSLFKCTINIYEAKVRASQLRDKAAQKAEEKQRMRKVPPAPDDGAGRHCEHEESERPRRMTVTFDDRTSGISVEPPRKNTVTVSNSVAI